jgi:hypothetical protein
MSLSVENKSLFLTLYADTTLYCYQKMIRYSVARHCADTLISMFQNNLCEIVTTAFQMR